MKVVTAPTCNRIQMTVNGFDAATRCSDHTCCREGLEIWLDQDPMRSTSNSWYCGSELTTGDTILSDAKTMVLFYSKIMDSTNTKQGFSVTLEFVQIEDCTK